MGRAYLPMLKYAAVHVHTDYTDGKNTVREYCQRAIQSNLEAIAFTEHVRKNLDYDFDNFLFDIGRAREEFPQLVILSGCEARIINKSGDLDASENVLKQCEIVIGVFHSFEYHDIGTYLTALKAMLKNQVINIWGHPTLFLRNHNLILEEKELIEIIDTCIENTVLIERNLKYAVPDAVFMELAAKRGARFVIGGDTHSIDELPTISRLEEEWEWINKMY